MVCHAGARPNRRPTASAATAQNVRTRASNVSVTAPGAGPDRHQRGRDRQNRGADGGAERATERGKDQAFGDELSDHRRRPAPRAPRTPSSRVRAVARARSRLATFAQHINSTNPTMPRKNIDIETQFAADQPSRSGSTVTRRSSHVRRTAARAGPRWHSGRSAPHSAAPLASSVR